MASGNRVGSRLLSAVVVATAIADEFQVTGFEGYGPGRAIDPATPVTQLLEGTIGQYVKKLLIPVEADRHAGLAPRTPSSPTGVLAHDQTMLSTWQPPEGTQ